MEQYTEMKIGLFFGSFNPIHNGHLIIGDLIRSQTELDELWFVISPQNPFKEKSGLLDQELRLSLIESALEGQHVLKTCDIEFALPQPSYTIDTLDKLKSDFPDYQFKIIMGSDNLAKLDKWKSGNRLIAENEFLIYPRLGYNNGVYDEYENFTFCDLPIVEISSTEIRKRIKSKQPFRFLVHKNVYDTIVSEKLYQ